MAILLCFKHVSWNIQAQEDINITSFFPQNHIPPSGTPRKVMEEIRNLKKGLQDRKKSGRS